jgi:hypothetical protein
MVNHGAESTLVSLPSSTKVIFHEDCGAVGRVAAGATPKDTASAVMNSK